MSDDIWDKFEKMLASHDWYYQFSDDPYWYQSGRDVHNEIICTMKYLNKIDKNRVSEIWNKFNPFGRK